MPSLFELFGYKVFFWSNENNEPIHVHIVKGKPVANSTKVWLTKAGGCVVANNNSKIPEKDIVKFIIANFKIIFLTIKNKSQY